MSEKAKLLMALKNYAESPLFNPYFKPKELLDETVGALGMYKAPFIKTKQEMDREMVGTQIADVLGKLVESGGPEVKMRIQEFLKSVMSEQGAEVGGGNGGEGGGRPVETPMPFPT
jgi:hypothetical protein